ncbi:ribonuclease E/G [Nakamurella leprariae]|uniref:Ribonuclease E n=1 Tax=Nakamurella leprariae TaxID=2803911 RepID=A0A939C2B7_9ACTN|nr:ribonuclease E/G [Nakamurella leprariae]MBM9468069.1 Rne/Rng family ribonuclease [Nakamurella leprariae]
MPRSTHPTTSSETPSGAPDVGALTAALDALPARPRVHQLAKLAGLTSKQVQALLTEQGHAAGSAQSAVDRDVAVQVLTERLSGADTAAAAEAPAAETPATEEPATEVPDETAPAAAGPLFLAPEAAATPTAADPDAAPVGDADAEDGAARPRRRRGRSTRGRGATAAAAPTDEQPTGEPATGAEPVATDPTADAAATADTASTEVTADDATADDEGAAEESAEEQDRAEGGRGRRRRRGRRGRGRAGDEAGEAGAGEDTAAAAEAGDESTEDGAAAATETTTAADRESGTDPAGDEDQADDQAEDGAGSRRRRRRRRRGGSDDAPREDDPDNTVVHVRESRSGQSARDAARDSGRDSASAEVQGVRGSTRLEAKRQRRRDSRGSGRRTHILTESEFLARRESVERVMAIRQRDDLAQVALLEDGVLVEHFVSRAGSESLIGSIFLGKVQNVLPSMEAAFVDIGRGRNAVLYAGEVNWDLAGLVGKARRIETALSSGDTVLVQVSKDPVGHKGARLTTQISLPGRFLVYVPGGGATGISRKLPDTERKRLKSILDRIVPEDAGVIIRTAAEGVPEEELVRDVERLKEQWEEISRRAEVKQSAPTQLSAEPDTLIKVVRDLFNSDIHRLVIDGPDAYRAVAEYVAAVAPELAERVQEYESPSSGRDVFSAYRIDEQIAKALERKVHLPSGGSLVIDRTEAMTVIDVNTGKYTGSGGNLEETVTRNNLEAAEEVVRQLRLRDIGGIIVVDFIDMVLESNRELVLRRLTECLGRDRSRHQVAEVTSLGLVQMTRKRMGTGLVEAFSEPCPHCGGRGLLLHAAPVDQGDETPAPTGERKSGKGRRNRGERRTEEPAKPAPAATVPVATVRPPDPRGPRPPRPSGVDAEPAPPLVEPVAAADDGAADRADEAGRPDDGLLASVLAAVDRATRRTTDEDAGGEPETTEPPQRGPSSADAPVTSTALVAPVDAPIDLDPVSPVEDEPSAVEPAQAEAPADPATQDAPAPTRSRRRRAAGRPAGAPATTAAVDMVLAPAEPVAVPAAATVNTVATGAAGTTGTTEAPAGRPRRRAVSRPAGPSGAASASAPVLVSSAASADGSGDPAGQDGADPS